MNTALMPVDDLWSLLDTPTIDPGRLVAAIEAAAAEPDLDWRTRQLIGEAWRAVIGRFGRDVVASHLQSYDAGGMQSLVDRAFAGHDPAEIKFPSLAGRLEVSMKSATIQQFLMALGKSLHEPVTITLGGSASLILRGYLERHTEDLDLTDEVPEEIRKARGTLADLASRFGLRLAHFQTHYLPPGWAGRTGDGGSYGTIHLRLIDPHDIIAGKVFSVRSRDQDDVRVVGRKLDKGRLLTRVHEFPASVWNDERLRNQARETWRIGFLEDLPLPPHAGVDP